jgi:hypothetical protein
MLSRRGLRVHRFLGEFGSSGSCLHGWEFCRAQDDEAESLCDAGAEAGRGDA